MPKGDFELLNYRDVQRLNDHGVISVKLQDNTWTSFHKEMMAQEGKTEIESLLSLAELLDEKAKYIRMIVGGK